MSTEEFIANVEDGLPDWDHNSGADLTYGEFGDKVLTHMREYETLQAVMRFGRDGYGAIVYVHTDTLPDWVPIAGEGRIVNTWSDGMREVVQTTADLEEWTTTELAAHETVSIGGRQVWEHLHTLAERGMLNRETDRWDTSGRTTGCTG